MLKEKEACEVTCAYAPRSGLHSLAFGATCVGRSQKERGDKRGPVKNETVGPPVRIIMNSGTAREEQ